MDCNNPAIYIHTHELLIAPTSQCHTLIFFFSVTRAMPVEYTFSEPTISTQHFLRALGAYHAGF